MLTFTIKDTKSGDFVIYENGEVRYSQTENRVYIEKREAEQEIKNILLASNEHISLVVVSNYIRN